jgi:hypothetical protein
MQQQNSAGLFLLTYRMALDRGRLGLMPNLPNY